MRASGTASGMRPTTLTWWWLAMSSMNRYLPKPRRLYGGYKVDPLPARRTVLEPRQPGIRTANVRAPADLPYVMLAWRAPTLRDVEKDRDVHALQVLAAVLDGHDGARLAKNVVRGSQVALSAGAGYDGTARGESLFIMDGTPAKGAHR